MQHRDGDDEGEIEPVGDEDVRFLALDDRRQEHQQIDHPDDGQPEIGVPFRLRIFLGLGDAEQISGAGDHDEEVVAQHDEPGRDIAGEPHAAGPLHDIERGREQHVAAERKDHRRRMQRPQAAEARPGQVEIQRRPGQLRGDDEAHQESGDTPEHRGNCGELDRPHVVVRTARDLLRRQLGRTIIILVEDGERGTKARNRAKRRMERKAAVMSEGGGDNAKECQRDEHGCEQCLADGHRLRCSCGLCHEHSFCAWPAERNHRRTALT